MERRSCDENYEENEHKSRSDVWAGQIGEFMFRKELLKSNPELTHFVYNDFLKMVK